MDIKLSCECGKVHGVAVNITPKNGNRIVCCCDDCQAFAKYLGEGISVVDEFGGSDLYQTSQSQIKIYEGVEHLRCARLTSKGLNRWYSDCCRTPIANMLGSGNPFIGIYHNFMAHNDNRTKELGPVLAHVQTQHALGSPDYPNGAKKFPVGITFRMVKKMLVWKAKGMHKPTVFFGDDGRPIVKPKIILETKN